MGELVGTNGITGWLKEVLWEGVAGRMHAWWACAHLLPQNVGTPEEPEDACSVSSPDSCPPRQRCCMGYSRIKLSLDRKGKSEEKAAKESGDLGHAEA